MNPGYIPTYRHVTLRLRRQLGVSAALASRTALQAEAAASVSSVRQSAENQVDAMNGNIVISMNIY